jgi:hypothetical protein
LGAKKLGILFDSDYVTCDNITLTGELSKEYELPLYAHIGLNKSSPTYSNIVESYLREFMQNGVDVIHGCTYYDLCVEVFKTCSYFSSCIYFVSPAFSSFHCIVFVDCHDHEKVKLQCKWNYDHQLF